MLEKYDGGTSKREYDFITGDESQLYYFDSNTKHQSKVQVASKYPLPMKVRRQRSVGNDMFANLFMKLGFNTIILL